MHKISPINSILIFPYKLIIRESKFFCLLSLFNIITVLLEYRDMLFLPYRESLKVVIYISCALFDVYILSLFLSAIKWNLCKRIIKVILYLFASFIFIADIFCFNIYKHVIDVYLINVILQSDQITTYEYLLTYVFTFKTLLLCSVIIAFILLVYKLSKFITRISFFSYLMSILIYIVALGFFTMVMHHNIAFSQRYMSIARVSIGFISQLQANKSYEEISKIMDKVNDYECQGMTVSYKNPLNIVIILGESCTRSHMSLYGYNLKTTPIMDKLAHDNELLVFDDVISCGNNTYTSMAQIFNFVEKDHVDLNTWYESPNIIDILKRANYRTVWLTNQAGDGAMNIDTIYGSRSHESSFTTNAVTGGTSRNYDEYLFPLIDKSLENSKNNNFYVIHLEGEHPPYYLRYPDSFKKFSALDIKGEEENNRKKVKASYDNAVYYTDYILGQIIERFKNKNSVVLYFSDHGEDVCLNSDYYGHTLENQGSLQMIEIPFLVWTSKTFQETHSNAYMALKQSIHRPLRTDYIIHTILSLAGVQTKSFNDRLSLISSKFDEDKVRLYNKQQYKKNSSPYIE